MSSDQIANDKKNMPTNKTDDALAKRATEKGEENAKNREIEQEKNTIRLTKTELDKLQKLMSRLALSREAIVESAISLFNNNIFKEKKNSLEKVKQLFPINENKDQEEREIELSLSSEAKKKVNQLGMEEDVENCVKLAINLYDHAIQTLYNENIESTGNNSV